MTSTPTIYEMAINLNEVKFCTLCRSHSLLPTEDFFKITDILKRWEKETTARFRVSVMDYYKGLSFESVRLYHCSICGLRVFIPLLSGTSEFYADITANDSYYVSDKWEFRRAVRDLKRFKCERVLDIGCGSGDFLHLLKKKLPHIEAHGYEFNSIGAESARDRGHVVYSGLFPESVSEGIDHPYDALCMFQVIEHFSDPVGLIKSALTLLKQEGLLIVSVPNCEGPVRFFSTALTDIPPHHVTRWCEKTFRVGIQRHGLEICVMRYEPLPSYLWNAYLPVIFEHTFILHRFGALLNRKGVTKRFIKFLNFLKVKELWGVTGHSLYVVIKRKRDW